MRADNEPKHIHSHIMELCIAAARSAARRGDYAVAAAIVDGNSILSLESSRVLNGVDPTAHPEMEAIRNVARQVGSRYLRGAVLYSTLEPCPMCAAAAVWAKMDGIVFGAFQRDASRWGRAHPDERRTWRQIHVSARYIALRGTPKLWVIGGVCRTASIELFAAE